MVSKEPQTISTVTEISPWETPAVAESPVEKPLLPPLWRNLKRKKKPLCRKNTTPVEVAEETTSPQATEEEPKRIVFRHPDAKPYWIKFSRSPLSKPEANKPQPEALPSRIILDRTIDRIIIITTVITITLITTSRLKRKCMSLMASLQEPAC